MESRGKTCEVIIEVGNRADNPENVTGHRCTIRSLCAMGLRFIPEGRKDSLNIRRRRQLRECETLLLRQSEHHPDSIKMAAHWAYASPVSFGVCTLFTMQSS